MWEPASFYQRAEEELLRLVTPAGLASLIHTSRGATTCFSCTNAAAAGKPCPSEGHILPLPLPWHVRTLHMGPQADVHASRGLLQQVQAGHSGQDAPPEVTRAS